MSTELLKNSFKSMSSLGRIHQFPTLANPRLYLVYSFKSMVCTSCLVVNVSSVSDWLKSMSNGRESTVNRALDGSIYPG